jgi:hypothetical protein
VFEYFIAADEWILSKVFQPIVNWVWENIGISRRSLCRIAIAITSLQDSNQHRWFLILVDFWLFVNTWMPITKVDLGWFPIFRFIMVMLLIFDVFVFLADDHDILNLMARISFVGYLYFMQANDPPTKRKNWKSALDRFSSQWTWLQPSAAK